MSFTLMSLQRRMWAVYMLILWSVGSVCTQDLAFSQFYLAPTYLNPGFTGMTDAPRFNLNYRYQYPSFGVAYKSLMFSVDKAWRAMHSGFGLRFALDDAGDGILKNTSASLNYVYQLSLRSGFKLHMGLDLTFGQFRLDQTKLVFGDQLDPFLGQIFNGGVPQSTSEIIDQNQRNYLSTGMGVVAQSDRYFLGISLHNLNSPDISFLKRVENGDLPVRASVQGGFFIPLRDLGITSLASINPVFNYIRQRQARQLEAGAIWHSDIVQLGILYRQVKQNADALIFSLGMERDMFRIGYSYDFTLSQLSGATGGTHELGVLINLDKAEGYQKEPQYNDCFSIFR